MQIKWQIKETVVIMRSTTGDLMTSWSTCLGLPSGKKNGNDKDGVKSNKWAGSFSEITCIRVMWTANIIQGLKLSINKTIIQCGLLEVDIKQYWWAHIWNPQDITTKQRTFCWWSARFLWLVLNLISHKSFIQTLCIQRTICGQNKKLIYEIIISKSQYFTGYSWDVCCVFQKCGLPWILHWCYFLAFSAAVNKRSPEQCNT